MKWRLFKVLAVCLLFLFACNNKKWSKAEQIVKEWGGKEIIFPEGTKCMFMGQDTTCQQSQSAKYKLLVYTDSTGCTSCKLNIGLWKMYIETIDSILPNQVEYLFYFQPKDRTELDKLLKREKFEHIVFIDEDGKISNSNNFPLEMEYQCFLLNNDNKVISIGNPTLNPRIWNIYQEIFKSKG